MITLECQLNYLSFPTLLYEPIKTAQIEPKLIREREERLLVAGLLCWVWGD